MNITFQALQLLQTTIFIGFIGWTTLTLQDMGNRLDALADNVERASSVAVATADYQNERMSEVLGVLKSPLLCKAPGSMILRAGSNDIIINDSNIQR